MTEPREQVTIEDIRAEFDRLFAKPAHEVDRSALFGLANAIPFLLRLADEALAGRAEIAALIGGSKHETGGFVVRLVEWGHDQEGGPFRDIVSTEE